MSGNRRRGQQRGRGTVRYMQLNDIRGYCEPFLWRFVCYGGFPVVYPRWLLRTGIRNHAFLRRSLLDIIAEQCYFRDIS